MRTAVLGSTRGSAFRPLVAAAAWGELAAPPVLVLSDRSAAPILAFAREHGIPAEAVPRAGRSREEHDRALDEHLQAHRIELVLLVGYLRLLSPWFTERWRGRLVNIHPSLLPRHAGLMDRAVHEAVLAAGETETGCTLHLATEETDAGPVIAREICPVETGDTVDSLRARVQAAEARLLERFLHDPEPLLSAAGGAGGPTNPPGPAAGDP